MYLLYWWPSGKIWKVLNLLSFHRDLPAPGEFSRSAAVLQAAQPTLGRPTPLMLTGERVVKYGQMSHYKLRQIAWIRSSKYELYLAMSHCYSSAWRHKMHKEQHWKLLKVPMFGPFFSKGQAFRSNFCRSASGAKPGGFQPHESVMASCVTSMRIHHWIWWDNNGS